MKVEEGSYGEKSQNVPTLLLMGRICSVGAFQG